MPEERSHCVSTCWGQLTKNCASKTGPVGQTVGAYTGVCGDRGADRTGFAGDDLEFSCKRTVEDLTLYLFDFRKGWGVCSQAIHESVDIGKTPFDADADSIGVIKYFTCKLALFGKAVDCRAEADTLNGATNPYLLPLDPMCFQSQY